MTKSNGLSKTHKTIANSVRHYFQGRSNFNLNKKSINKKKI